MCPSVLLFFLHRDIRTEFKCLGGNSIGNKFNANLARKWNFIEVFILIINIQKLPSNECTWIQFKFNLNSRSYVQIRIPYFILSVFNSHFIFFVRFFLIIIIVLSYAIWNINWLTLLTVLLIFCLFSSYFLIKYFMLYFS